MWRISLIKKNKPFVKICGITRERDFQSVVDNGASAVGFIGFSKSPRYVSPQRVAELLKNIDSGDMQKVVVVVNASLDEINAYLAAGVDTVQLHGNEDAEFTAQIDAKVWKALRLKSEDEIEQFADFPCELFVIDSFVKDSAIPGGTGHIANWELAREFVNKAQSPVLLAGGIRRENALEALEEVQPYGLDLSSGVEESPGIKIPQKIDELFEALK